MGRRNGAKGWEGKNAEAQRRFGKKSEIVAKEQQMTRHHATLKRPRQSIRGSPPQQTGNTSIEENTAKCCCSSATSPRRYDGEKVRKGTCVEMCANLANAQMATTTPELWACNPRANASTTKVGRTSWSYMSEADTIPICDRRKRKGAVKARDFAMVLRRSGIADWQNLQNMSVA